jgi:hypothetical protein
MTTNPISKAITISCDGFETFEHVHLNIDCNSRMPVLHVHGESADRVLATNRSLELPCGVQHPEKIRAEKIGGRVVVIIPAESQVAIGPEPDTSHHEAIPLKVDVSVPPAGKLEIKHENECLMVTVLGLSSKDLAIDLDGPKTLRIAGRSSDGQMEVRRSYKLPRRVTDPDAITAKAGPTGVVISVPDAALERVPEKQRHRIAVHV